MQRSTSSLRPQSQDQWAADPKPETCQGPRSFHRPRTVFCSSFTSGQNRQTNNRVTRYRIGQALIDSRLLYGLELTWTCVACRELVSILFPVFLIAYGLLPSTPAEAACAEACVLPFRNHVQAAICQKAAVYASATSGNHWAPLLVQGDRMANSRRQPSPSG